MSTCEETRQFAYEWLNLMLEKYNNILIVYLKSSKNDLHSSLTTSESNQYIAMNRSLPMNYKRGKNNEQIVINNITYTPNSSIPKPPIFVGPVMNIQNEMEFNYMRVIHTKYSQNGKSNDNIIKQIPHKLFANVLEMIITQKNEKKLSETNGSFTIGTIRFQKISEPCKAVFTCNEETKTVTPPVKNPKTGNALPYAVIGAGIVIAGAVYYVTRKNTKLYKI